MILYDDSMTPRAVDGPGRPLRGRRPKCAVSGREALLCAALATFARAGYEATSLRMVAAEAGVDMALVARIFGSKAELWAAVVDRLAEYQAKHRVALAKVADDAAADPAGALVRLIEEAAQMSFEVPEFVAFLMQESGSPGERLETIRQRLLGPFDAVANRIVTTASAAGAVRAHDADLFGSMLMAAIALPMTAFRFMGGASADADLRDRIVREAVALFVVDQKEMAARHAAEPSALDADREITC